MPVSNVKRYFVFIFLIIALLWSNVAAQEDYSTWKYSLNIYINTSSSGVPTTIVLKQFPVLLRLDNTNFPFFDSVKTGGADIRFSNSAGTHLPYEIERWVNSTGPNDTAEIWVLVDTIVPDNQSQYIVMYWGKSTAADSSNGSKVFMESNGYAGVYHLSEDDKSGAGTANYYKDATGAHHGHDSIKSNNDNSGYIGRGHKFGPGDAIPTGAWNPSSKRITLSAWVKWVGDTTYWQAIIAKRNRAGVYWELNYSSNIKPKGISAWNGSIEHSFGGPMFSANQWHHVALSSENGEADKTILYVDGVKVGATTMNWGTQTDAEIIIGNTESYRSGTEGPDSGGSYWRGYLDEVRVENQAHSGDWINFCYQTQRATGQKVLTFRSKPIITVEPVSVQLKALDTAIFTVSAFGDSLKWQWYQSSDTKTWSIASGNSNSSIYRFKTSLTDSIRYFRCVVSNEHGSDTSNVVYLDFCKPITFTAQPANALDCPTGKLITFTVATNDTSHKFQWENSFDGVTWISIKDANLPSYSFAVQPTMKSGKYRCKVKSQCDSAYSEVATFTMCIPVTIALKPVNEGVIEGQVAIFTIGISGNPISYQWYSRKNGAAGWLPIPDAIDSAYSMITRIEDNGSLFRCVAKSVCDSIVSDSVMLTVFKKVRASFSVSDTVGQVPLSVVLTDSSTGDITSWKWFFGDKTVDSSATSSNPVHVYRDPNTYTIKLIVSGPGGIDSVTKTVRAFPTEGNPFMMSGRMVASNKILLRYSILSALRTAPPAIPYALSVKLFSKLNSIPVDTEYPVKLLKTYPALYFGGQSTEFFDTVTVDTIVPPDSSYGFTTQIVWNDGKSTSIAPHNGCIVLMRDTTRPVNKLTLSGSYTPLDTVRFIIDSIQALDWKTIDSVALWYGIGVDTIPDFSKLVRVKKWDWKSFSSAVVNGRFVYQLIDSQFNTDVQKLNCAVILIGKNKLQSLPATSFFYIGHARPENTVILQARSVDANTIRLSWNKQTGVEKMRILYSTKSIPFDNSFTGIDSINVSPDSVSYSINQLNHNTRYYFAAQIYKNGLWSKVTNASSATDSTPDAAAAMISNTIKITNAIFDSLNGNIIVNWTIAPTSETGLQIGISYTTPINTVGDSVVFQIFDVSQYSGVSTVLIREAIEFNNDYTIKMRLRRTNEKWTDVTPDSRIVVHIPQFGSQIVRYTFKPVKDSTLWVNNTIKLTTPAINITKPVTFTAKINAFVPSGSSLNGFVNVSNGFSFSQNSISDSLFVGLKCITIPAPYSIKDVRVYRFDGVNFHVEPLTIIDTVGQFVSVKTADLYRPFIALIDTLPPVISLVSKRIAFTNSTNDYQDTVSIVDNIANLTWYYKCAKGGDPLFKSGFSSQIVTASKSQNIITINSQKNYIDEDGARSIVYAYDGRTLTTLDLSRRVRIANCDTLQTNPFKWVPVKVASILDSTSISNVVKKLYVSAGIPSYNPKHMRFFCWYPSIWNAATSSKWVEYSPEGESEFTLSRGRLFWIKTRNKLSVSLGSGISMSFTDTVKIPLIPQNWTDFGLPFHFDMRLSDIITTSRVYSSKIDSVQFYQWVMDPITGRYTASAFYIPGLYNAGVSDPTRIMSAQQKSGFTAWNPTKDTIYLAFAPSLTKVDVKPPSLLKTQSDNSWFVKITPHLMDGHTMSPIFCGFDARLSKTIYYPLPPSLEEMNAGVVDSSGDIHAHMIINKMSNDGCSYKLAFTNNSGEPQQIRCALKSLGNWHLNNNVAIYDEKNNTLNYVDSAGCIIINVESGSTAFYQLLAGSTAFINNFKRSFIQYQLGLVKILPNPIRNSVLIRYTLPSSPVKKIDFIIVNMQGKTVWRVTDRKESTAGCNRSLCWGVTNSRGQKVSSGVYILKMIAYDNHDKSIGQFDQKLTVLR